MRPIRRPAAVPAALLLCALLHAGRARAQSTLPAFAGGTLPAQLSMVVGWEQAQAALTVDKTGRVSGVELMAATPGFEGPVKTALAGWRFRPATGPGGHPVPSHVLVVVIYRPPVLYNTPTIGNPMRQLAAWPASVPFPIATTTPAYPPQAAGDDVVLVTMRVGADGTLTDARTTGPPSGFDQASLDAARQWRFRPARPGGTRAPSAACLIFGFRQPVATPPVR
ncbi:MAG TPA: TonB family protein [Vicinamibacterales bacterium]|nr:TonB family protein [Vicinamibacterales bacterium]